MNRLPALERSILQRWVARGFADPPTRDQRVCVIRQTGPIPTGRTKVAVFLPTMIEVVASDELATYLDDLARQIVGAHIEQSVEMHLFVGMQYRAAGERAGTDALNQLLRRLDSALAPFADEIGITAFVCEGPGKILTINQMTEMAALKGIGAVILVDDDVAFSEGCFSRMIEAFLPAEQPIAIGARKIGRAFNTRASSLLHRLKAYTEPAENYPHACCMILSLDVILPKIPEIYSSDDGYICFRLLAAADANPLGKLLLVDGAYCYHLVGGRNTDEITSRIRRMLLHHHLFLSHADEMTARYYLAKILFFGLWPWVPFDSSKGFRRGAIKCLLKYVYALWFTKIGAELIVRGAYRRPLREIDWGGGRSSTDNAKHGDEFGAHVRA